MFKFEAKDIKASFEIFNYNFNKTSAKVEQARLKRERVHVLSLSALDGDLWELLKRSNWCLFLDFFLTNPSSRRLGKIAFVRRLRTQDIFPPKSECLQDQKQ